MTGQLVLTAELAQRDNWIGLIKPVAYRDADSVLQLLGCRERHAHCANIATWERKEEQLTAQFDGRCVCDEYSCLCHSSVLPERYTDADKTLAQQINSIAARGMGAFA